MSIVTHAFVFDKYGPRLGAEQLAGFLEIDKKTLYNKLTSGTCPVKTYVDPSNNRRYADYRDVADYLDTLRETAA